LYEWLLYKKNVCIPTQKCVLYREPEYSIYFQTKKGTGGEQVPPSEDKRIRRQDKVDDLKSDAKRQKVISSNHIPVECDEN
jgi:hypothetical protein